MAEGLRPVHFSPIPGAATRIVAWEVNQGRRLAPGGGVNGAAGDGPGGRLWPTIGDMPYINQGWYGPNGRSPVYRGDQFGGRLYPNQPYRAAAGIMRQNATPPMPLLAHFYGGAKSLGAPVTQTLKENMAALLALRQRATQAGVPGGSLGGTGVGTRMGGMVGASFNPIPRQG